MKRWTQLKYNFILIRNKLAQRSGSSHGSFSFEQGRSAKWIKQLSSHDVRFNGMVNSQFNVRNYLIYREGNGYTLRTKVVAILLLRFEGKKT